METPSKLLVAFAGVVVGMLVFVSLIHWLHALAEIRSASTDKGSMARKALLATLLGSGPWMLVALGILAYYVRTERWAIWLFGSIAAAWCLFGILIGYHTRISLKVKRESDPNPRVPSFVRFVLWVAPRKQGFLVVHGLALATLQVVLFAVLPEFRGLPFGFWFTVAVCSFFGGILMGWFFWQGFIWPTLAAYPGSPNLPPSLRPYERADTESADTQAKPTDAP